MKPWKRIFENCEDGDMEHEESTSCSQAGKLEIPTTHKTFDYKMYPVYKKCSHVG